MKKIYVTLIFAVISYSLAISQSTTVTFMHGLNDELNQVWNFMEGQLDDDFEFYPYFRNYNSEASIPSTASSIFIPDQSVVVAHSQGGLVAREYLRQQGTNKVKSLITLGTPHRGAPIANVTDPNSQILQLIIAEWVNDLIRGPFLTLGEVSGSQFVQIVMEELGILISGVVGSEVGIYARENFGDFASVEQMKPGSSFLNTLNNNPGNTLPSSKYAIYGVEDFQSHARLSHSIIRKGSNQNPTENGSGAKLVEDISSYYLYAANVTLSVASEFYLKFTQKPTWDVSRYEDFNKYQVWLAASEAWYQGYLSLSFFMAVEWEVYIVGAQYYYDGPDLFIEMSDGFIPASSQAPSFFGGQGTNVLRAVGANHIEETHHQSVRTTLVDIFGRPDVLVPERTTSGGGGDPGGPGPTPLPIGGCQDGDDCQ